MRKRSEKLMTVLLAMFLATGLLTACGQTPAAGNDESSSLPGESVSEKSTSDPGSPDPAASTADVPVPEAREGFRSMFIKCGKADMIVLEGGFGTAVIDTGEDDDGDKLTEFLSEEGVDKVDFLIITHFDKDHVGGASWLLDHFPVGKIYIPDYEGTSSEYYDFMDKLEELGYGEGGGSEVSGQAGELIRVIDTIRFTAGDVRFTIDPPESYVIPPDVDEYDNELSLITIAEHGSTAMLFMGDAENTRIGEFMAGDLIEQCDLVKIPHHGKYHSQLKNVISSLRPDYAVITDSAKNPAEKKTLDMLADNDVQVFSTAEGNATAISDGKTVTVTEE